MKDTLLLAAVARREDVLKVTRNSTETNFANNVYWYNCPSKAFGFSSHPTIELRSADICDEEGGHRLSWHLTSQGGWRAGMFKNLNRDAEGGQYEKIILVSPSERRARPLFQGRRVRLKEEAEGETFEAYRPDGTPCTIHARDLKARRAATVLEMGQASFQGKWRVSADADGHGVVMFWVDERALEPTGPSFPVSVRLANCQFAQVPPALQLQSIGSFPLQAVTALSLASNSLERLPDDFLTAFPSLSSLDLSNNLFSSFPAALGSSLCLREVDLQRNARLEEGTWLREIMSRWPSFPSDPPPMLEVVRVDLQLVSELRELLMTLARRTIQRNSSTRIDLSGRGLGDDEVLELLPQLLDACDRRRGVMQVLESTLLPHPQEHTLALLHEHELRSEFSSGACCHVCGNMDIEGAETEGFACDHPPEGSREHLRNDKGAQVFLGARGVKYWDKYHCMKPFDGASRICGSDGAQCESCQRFQAASPKPKGCEFFVCRSCVDFVGQSDTQCLRCIDAAGRRFEFLVYPIACGSRLQLKIDGEVAADGVSDIRWDSHDCAICVGDERLILQNEDRIPTMKQKLWLLTLVEKASAPRCTWTEHEPCSVGVAARSDITEGSKVDADNEDAADAMLSDSDRGKRGNRGRGGTAGGKGAGRRGKQSIDCAAEALSASHIAGKREGTKVGALILDLRGNRMRSPEGLVQQLEHRGAIVQLDSCSAPGATSVGALAIASRGEAMQVDGKQESIVDVRQVENHFINDSLFTGQLKDNKEDGEGIRLYAEGCRLQTCWVDGKRCGKAVCLLDGGGKWELEYQDDQITGKASGSTVDGTFHGHVAEVVFAPGKKEKPQVGTIVTTISDERGAPEGLPALHFRADQSLEIVEVMQWQNAWYATETNYTTLWFPLSSTNWHTASRKHGKGKKNKQEQDDARLCSLVYVPSGQGCMKHKDGSEYHGEWKDGEPHGAGKFQWAPARHQKSPPACYEGNWSNGKLDGTGVMTWADGAKFTGTFSRNCPVAGVLEKPSAGGVVSSSLKFNLKSAFECPSGHEMSNLSSRPDWTCDQCGKLKRINPRMRCARCDYDICEKCRKETAHMLYDLLQTPQLPPPLAAKDIGRISANLWSAIENGAAESYGHHARALELSVADRILVKSLHVQENPSTSPPGSRREALTVKFQHGNKATEQILKAMSVADAAKKLQWAIEVDATAPPLCAAKMTQSDVGMLKVAQLQRHLKARGVKPQGKKAELQGMLAAVLAAEGSWLDEDEVADARMQDGDEFLDADEDDIAQMVHAGSCGLADYEVAGCTLFRLTAANSLQPDPLCVHKMDHLRSSFAAVGRLIGCALWNGKTLGAAPARFFCRRLLEAVRMERLKAFDVDGAGPPFFGLVGSLVRIKASSSVDFEGCPKPILRPPPGGSHTYEVLEATSKGDKVFIRCQALRDDPRHGMPGGLGLDAGGWTIVSASDAKLVSRRQCEELWGSMKRLHRLRPYNGTFVVPKGCRAICGQPVRVRKLLPPPIFFQAGSGANKSAEQPALERQLRKQEAQDANLARRTQEAQDEAFAVALSAGLSEAEAALHAQTAAARMIEADAPSLDASPSKSVVSPLG